MKITAHRPLPVRPVVQRRAAPKPVVRAASRPPAPPEAEALPKNAFKLAGTVVGAAAGGYAGYYAAHAVAIIVGMGMGIPLFMNPVVWLGFLAASTVGVAFGTAKLLGWVGGKLDS